MCEVQSHGRPSQEDLDTKPKTLFRVGDVCRMRGFNHGGADAKVVFIGRDTLVLESVNGEGEIYLRHLDGHMFEDGLDNSRDFLPPKRTEMVEMWVSINKNGGTPWLSFTPPTDQERKRYYATSVMVEVPVCDRRNLW